jgi:cytochrome c peroxidase
MNSRIKAPGILTLVLLIAAAGCDRAERSEAIVGPDTMAPAEIGGGSGGAENLNDQLEELLNGLAPSGHGREFFRLPHPTDLANIPQDPKNPLNLAKVRLGRRLFHESALGIESERAEGTETYSCASCHHAQGGFQANLPQGLGEGGSGFGARGEARVLQPQYDGIFVNKPDLQPIRTPSAMNSAFQAITLWNGQFGGVGMNLGTEHAWIDGTPTESNWLGFEGLETQAHAGLSVHRMGDISATYCYESVVYQEAFEAAFPGDPDPVNHLNAALAIAAYERTLLSNGAPFQQWLVGDRNAMTDMEKRGALVFFGKAGCASCHTGPALNSMGFHALGMGDLDHSYDLGRVNLTQFFGTIPWTVRLGRGGFTGRVEDYWKFKVPQLYNLADSPFYGHGASLASLREVVEYKNLAVPENPYVVPSDLSDQFLPLNLTEVEITEMTAFLETGLYDPFLRRYLPKNLPSGDCFPVNDPQGRVDLGCDIPPAVGNKVALD